MTKAVFFDIDGTLLDTTEYIYQAFEHSLATHDHAVLLRDSMSRMIGKTLEQCYQEFTKSENVESLMDMHKQFQIDNPQLIRPFPHTEKTLKELRAKDLKIAAITSRSSKTGLISLEVVGIADLIDYFVGFDDVKAHKPDPEGIHKSLEYFSLMPEDAIMVGDSPQDVQAGKNAGVKTVGVTYGFHGQEIAKSEPDFVIHDIHELVRYIIKP